MITSSSTRRQNRNLHSFPTRRSSDLNRRGPRCRRTQQVPTRPPGRRQTRRCGESPLPSPRRGEGGPTSTCLRSEEHTSELQSRFDIVCRLLLEKKKKKADTVATT